MRKCPNRAVWESQGPNVVVHHTILPGEVCPSLTPFAVKLESFFRLAKIDYKNDYEEPMGPKNKVPWITINGEDISDSEIIIDRLQQMFNIHPDASVPLEENAVATAMRIMMEEHFYWGLVSWRYDEDAMNGLFKVFKLPLLQRHLIKSYRGRVQRMLYNQGTGRHSFEEVHSFMKKDLEALSVYIGKPLLDLRPNYRY
ncbi:hypothetical protein HAZT_HAZT005279 [Hyalella azteca]|uniref:Thioredoxin-like fold domain-containing protein n=1 Tax=Hyalella azteca TaxID=294128 RepID=A0A6A0H2T6_HYAAZ|nr:hypothetical protein HAZT_HAZT005279 [Hyalella azteca]